MYKSIEDILYEAGDNYQDWYDAIINIKLKGE